VLAFLAVIFAIGVARHDAALLVPAHLILFAIGVALFIAESDRTAPKLQKNLWIAATNVLFRRTAFGWLVPMARVVPCGTWVAPCAAVASRRQVLFGH
jgi:hypothetical protein